MTESLKLAALELMEGFRTDLPGLRIDINPDDPNVDISVRIPKQSGLEFEVYLQFDNHDELYLGAGDFWCSWFPFSKPEVILDYRDAVLGIISGRYRIVEYRRWGRRAGAHLQTPHPQGWETVARSSVGILSLIPSRWGLTERILQNRP